MGIRYFCLYQQDRLLLHHGIIMVRLVTGFFFSVSRVLYTKNPMSHLRA